MEYQTTTRAASRVTADCIVAGVYERGRMSIAAADIDSAAKGWLTALLKSGDVSHRRGSAIVVPAPPEVRAKRVLVVGLGAFGTFGLGEYRKSMAAVANAVRERKIGSLAIGLTLEDVSGASSYYLARQSGETVESGLYRFDTMKSGRRKARPSLKKITLLVKQRKDAKPAGLGAAHGSAIADGMSLSRDLGNLPPNVCTPSYLARTARDLAKKHSKLSTKVLSETEIKRLGMGSFLSVTGGTEEPARLIVMQYRGTTGKPVALIGKGITFDAGGISLKPGPGMDEMKFDMCGAAAVIATISVIAALKLPINVVAIVPTCENLPSGTATRPGDIVTSMSGQTIEILNTDAEGRLILCDAITYARRFKPDAVVDVATLTGACVIALGHHRTAVMSTDDELSDELVAAGLAAEDKAWPLPLADEYAESLKSNFADFANVGGREGGAITAGCFLAKFAKDLNWAHLDIAGTAWHGGARKGATGRPVPLLSQFLLERAGVVPR